MFKLLLFLFLLLFCSFCFISYFFADISIQKIRLELRKIQQWFPGIRRLDLTQMKLDPSSLREYAMTSSALRELVLTKTQVACLKTSLLQVTNARPEIEIIT